MNEPSSDIEQRLHRIGESLRESVSLSESVLGQLDDDDTFALQDESPRPATFISQLGDSKMIRRISISGIAAATLMTLGIWLSTSSSSISFAQVAENLRQASSCSAAVGTLVTIDGQSKTVMTGKYHWRAPHSYRHESMSADPAQARKQHSVLIMFRDKAGISIDHVQKKYRSVNAKRGYASPLMMLQELHRFKDVASKDLGQKEIDGTECDGFEIDLNKIDSNVANGTMSLWVDRKSRLPRQILFSMQSTPPTQMIMKDFVWNEQLDASLFSTDAPKGYVDTTPPEKTPSEIADTIIGSLRLFAEFSGGKYPQVKVVYGDITRDTLMELAGFKGRDLEDIRREDNYHRIMESTKGWAQMNEIMVSNHAAVYHGRDVDASMKDRVLFGWQIDDGKYQVIYGDLRTQTRDSL